MPLDVTVIEKQAGIFIIAPSGSLDSETAEILEEKVDELLAGSPRVVIFDMGDVGFISSLGVRVIVKTKKTIAGWEGSLLVMKLQPPVKKVFDIVYALSPEEILKNAEELDRILDKLH